MEGKVLIQFRNIVKDFDGQIVLKEIGRASCRERV